MNKRKFSAVIFSLVLVLAVAGCSDDKDSEKAKKTTATTAVPKFAMDTSMHRIQMAGKIKVGVKYDQPGFGLKNPTSGDVEGFDVEIAKLIAASIYGGDAKDAASKIEFTETVSKNRQPFIQQGNVDIVIATYTINDTRKQVVDFAGPYFVAKQDIMVKADNTTIKAVGDLNGKKVCSVKGSTSEKNLTAKAPRAAITLFDTYSQCAEALTDGRVEAVTTDNTILAGFVSGSSGAFKLLEAPFADEPYGIGLKKGDDTFREFLNKRLEAIYKDGSWAKAFTTTLGKIGLKTPQPPVIDRYNSTPATGATTTVAAGSGVTSTTAAGSRSGVTTTTKASATTNTTAGSYGSTVAP